jgi:uncharacterized protein
MADTSGKPELQEPSMEDILASIRRILAEDGSTGPAETELPPVPAARPMPTSASEAAVEAVPEEPDERPAPRPAPATSAAALAESLFDDVEPAYTPPPRRPLPPVDDESTDVLSQLARAILDRRDMSVSSRSVTLEDMVREMLRPLLREWLDRNLPYLIERLVKKEIDLMINRAERLED